MFLFILIDALGWDLVRNMDVFADLVLHRCPTKSILGYSSAAIPTLLTGTMPQEHRHWNLFYLSPETSPFRWFGNIPTFFYKYLNNKYPREVLRRISKFKSRYNGTFTVPHMPFEYASLFDICEKTWLYEERSIDNIDNLFDFLRVKNISYQIYTYNKLTDEQCFSKAKQDIKKKSYDFYFLYLVEMDKLLHEFIDDPEHIKTKIQWYERQILEITNLCKNASTGLSRLLICSDHGMARVTNTVDLVEVIDSLGLTFGYDYLVFYDSTMARFWFMTARGKKKISSALERLSCGRILPDEELRTLGIFFEDKRYGELVFLLNEGWIIHPGLMGKWLPKGMHGYHPDCPSSDGVFMTNWEPPILPTSISHIFDVVKAAYQ